MNEPWTPPRRTTNKVDLVRRPGEPLVGIFADSSCEKWWQGPFERMADGDLRYWRNRNKISSHIISAIIFERARALSATFTAGASIALMYSWDASGVLSPGQLIRISLDGVKDPEHSIDDIAAKVAAAIDRAAQDVTDFNSLCVEMSAALTICRDDNGAFYLEMNVRIAGIENSETITTPGIAIVNIQKEYDRGLRDFSERKIRGSDLRGGNLSGSNFYSADLRFSNLSACNLSACNFELANLRGCDLSDANLSGSNLCGANISGANLEDLAA